VRGQHQVGPGSDRRALHQRDHQTAGVAHALEEEVHADQPVQKGRVGLDREVGEVQARAEDATVGLDDHGVRTGVVGRGQLLVESLDGVGVEGVGVCGPVQREPDDVRTTHATPHSASTSPVCSPSRGADSTRGGVPSSRTGNAVVQDGPATGTS
jgi:hypothetical protein